MTTLDPGSTIGIVGGGQLGRMLAQSARQHGYGVAVLTGGAENTPAGVLADREFSGSFDDPETVSAFFEMIDAMTWEFENVDVALADAAEAAGLPVRPAGSIIAAAQDRKLEKEVLRSRRDRRPVAASRDRSRAGGGRRSAGYARHRQDGTFWLRRQRTGADHRTQ